VGGGSAAFEAAIAARQAGAENVVMLEKATPGDFGGNARYSHTGFRCVYNAPEEIRAIVPEVDDATFSKFHLPGYSEQLFMDDLNRVTRGRIDQELAHFMVTNSYAAVSWMHESGMKFEPERHAPIKGRHYFQPGIISILLAAGWGRSCAGATSRWSTGTSISVMIRGLWGSMATIATSTACVSRRRPTTTTSTARA
jgi:tricarballylate dehydrogenase